MKISVFIKADEFLILRIPSSALGRLHNSKMRHVVTPTNVISQAGRQETGQMRPAQEAQRARSRTLRFYGKRSKFYLMETDL